MIAPRAAGRRPCGSVPTPEAPSPTWWPTTDGGQGAVDARRSGPRVRAGLAARATAGRVLAHGTTVATNALLGGQTAPGRARHHRGLRRRDRDRPPGPPVALRHRPWSGRRRSCRGTGASRWPARSPPTAPSSAARPRRLPPSPDGPRRWRCASCTPTSTRPRAGGGGGAASAGATTSPARTRCRRRCGSTSAR